MTNLRSFLRDRETIRKPTKFKPHAPLNPNRIAKKIKKKSRKSKNVISKKIKAKPQTSKISKKPVSIASGSTKTKSNTAKISKPKTTKSGKSKPFGLAGKVSSGLVAGTVDSGVPPSHAHASIRLDARLALVDPSVNSDKYYVLQALEKDSQFFVWTRWGRTGTSGQGKMEGPMTLEASTKVFRKIFKEKTKVAYEDAVGGASHVTGHYRWLDTAGDDKHPVGTWEYYIDDGVDGKPTGWYPYTSEGSKTTEELYRTFVVCGNGTMGVRFVHSGHFTYKVDLTDPAGNYTQQNMDVPPNKMRKIRRVVH